MTQAEDLAQAAAAAFYSTTPEAIETIANAGPGGTVVQTVPPPAPVRPGRGDGAADRWVRGRAYFVDDAGAVYELPSNAVTDKAAARFLSDPGRRQHTRIA